MNYVTFETKIRFALSSQNGPKSLLKIINAPYRFWSTLSPLNMKIKYEQSFLRTQENNYYKFIKNCAEEIFAFNEYELIDNHFKIQYANEEGDIISKIIVSGFSFIDKENNLNIVFIKKHDTLSKKQTIELTNKYEKIMLEFKKIYQDKNIVIYNWFIDPLQTKNFEFFSEYSQNYNSAQTKINFVYGAMLFDNYNLKDSWNKIENNIKQFKKQNYDFFLLPPDLNTDQETYEFMINMSQNSWDKLLSNDYEMTKVRETFFNVNDPKSNINRAKMDRINIHGMNQNDIENEISKLI